MVIGRGYCSAVFGLTGCLLVSGGMDGAGLELQSLESFDLKAGR